MKYFGRWFIFVLLTATACTPEPEQSLQDAHGLAFSGDSQTERVTPEEYSSKSLRTFTVTEPGEARVLEFGKEIGLESFSIEFLPNRHAIIEASSKNVTEDLEFTQPFFFSVHPISRNIARSVEPELSAESLGGDGVLIPGEVTSKLKFEIEYTGFFFLYLVNANAGVKKVGGSGDTFTVNTSNDAEDANPGDGVCEAEAGNGVCTLLAAVQETNALPGLNTVEVPAGDYTLNLSYLTISDDLILNGAAQDDTVIIAGDNPAIDVENYVAPPVLQTTEDTTVTVRNLTVEGGSTNLVRYKTGILNGGTLTLEDVKVTGNISDTFSGVGIVNDGRLSLLRTTVEKSGTDGRFPNGTAISNKEGGDLVITDSQIMGYRGFVISNGGTLRVEGSVISKGSGSGLSNSGEATLIRSVIRDNRFYEGNGGGIANYLGGTVRLEDSLVENNSVGSYSELLGGGIYNNGAMTVVRSTISHNSTDPGYNNKDAYGGGIYNDSEGTLVLENSTLSRNIVGADDDVLNNGGQGGGGLYNKGKVSIINTTFSENASYITENEDTTVTNIGGSIFNGGTVEFSNTIFANSDALNECDGPGTFISQGNNLTSDASCNLDQSSDLSDTDPLLNSLADNGALPPLMHY